MKLSKKFAYYKKVVGDEPLMVHLTRNVAIEMYAQRKPIREMDWDLAMGIAFAMRASVYDPIKAGDVIQLHSKTNELLSGTNELLGLILSGLKSYPLWISFPDPGMFISPQDAKNLLELNTNSSPYRKINKKALLNFIRYMKKGHRKH